MNISLSHIASIVSGDPFLSKDIKIEEIVYDTRKLSHHVNSLFVAFTHGSRNGHKFIKQAKLNGCENFLIEQSEYRIEDDCNYILVKDSLKAYQAIAQYFREQVNIPVIGITGSNGKTIIKEWLSDCLSEHFHIVKTPKSYNSKIGVPESVMPINSSYNLAIFEAGISEPNEMVVLQKIIQPTIGIFTNIGDAHSDNFDSNEQKTIEKLTLFKQSEVLICQGDNNSIAHLAKDILKSTHVTTWGRQEDNAFVIRVQMLVNHASQIQLSYQGNQYTFTLPSTNSFGFENYMHVICTALYLGLESTILQKKLTSLSSLPMRLQVLDGVRNMKIINDSYTTDKQAFKYALDYTKTHFPDRKLVIVSSKSEQANLEDDFSQHQTFLFNDLTDTVDAIVNNIDKPEYDGCVLLIKGKRTDRLERIAKKLSLQTHSTTLEINLSNIASNLAVYLEQIHNSTKILAVVKASAYGSGSTQVGQYLSSLRIDYLAVALLDEGIELRKSGITKPILIFNYFFSNDASLLWEYDLEPEVYALNQLSNIAEESKLQKKTLKLHIKIDTGMNRLGFLASEFDHLAKIIDDNPNLVVESIFSHLSASDNPSFDDFTTLQFRNFDTHYSALTMALGYQPWRHILNTAGIIRHPLHQYNAVRIGIGLYGIDETDTITHKLHKVHTLSTIVLQIKTIQAGESLSYNRSFIADKQMNIAILGAGYADGIPRSAARHNCSFQYQDQKLPLVGTVCMDVCFVDITNIENISVGSVVEIFGEHMSISDLASKNETIPYEILSQIPSRIKRVYIED